MGAWLAGIVRLNDRFRVRGAARWLFLGLTILGSGNALAAVEVKISGLTPELERNVRAYLSIAHAQTNAEGAATSAEQTAGEAAVAEERRVRRLHAAAPEQIATALQPFGYYEPQIDARLERTKDGWIASYAIQPGPPTRLTKVDIEAVGEGRDVSSIRTARNSLKLAPGQVLDHAQYEAAKEKLYDAAYDAGFIDAAYRRSELLVRRAKHEAEIHLLLDTGPRYYFGRIKIDQTILNPGFVQRFVTIRYGEPFTTSRLVALQIALNDSGYFTDVVADVERDRSENRHIPVTIRTKPGPRREYTVGFGYGTDTGPRIRTGVDLRRIGRRGHRFRADLRLSQIKQTATAEYRIPTKNVSRDFFALVASLGYEEIGGWETRMLSFGPAWQADWRRLRRHVYLTAQREQFATAVTEPQTENVLYGGVELTAKAADDPLYPQRGYSWSLDVRAGAEPALQAASFERLLAQGNVVRSFGKRLRVLLRGQYGALHATDFDELVPSQRFYAGGDGSVRGYAYESLGPEDQNGANIGGRYLFTASAELELHIVGNYGAALFYDVGNAANDPWPKLKRGVGIGMRWRSPVGAVGIDIAHPLDDPETSYRLHLRIGSEL